VGAAGQYRDFEGKTDFPESKIKSKSIKYNWHDLNELLEAIFARGDRKLGKVLLKAFEKGCKFDSWGEHFKFDKWMEAFRECGIDPSFYANRKRSYGEILPWDHMMWECRRNFWKENMKRH